MVDELYEHSVSLVQLVQLVHQVVRLEIRYPQVVHHLLGSRTVDRCRHHYHHLVLSVDVSGFAGRWHHLPISEHTNDSAHSLL